MNARCDVSDMLVDECDHCVKGLKQLRDALPRARHHKTAVFNSKCPDCRGDIEVGDQLGYVADFGHWVCPRCFA